MRPAPPAERIVEQAAPRFPSLGHVWMALLFATIAMRALLWPIRGGDYYWQLAYGRLIAESGSIPHFDIFSQTQAGQPYFDQPWLSQWLMFQVHRLGGAGLSLVVLAALLLLSYGALLRIAIWRTRQARRGALVLLLSLPAAMTNWSVRSQMFAMPLFAAVLLILEHWRRSGSHRAIRGHALWLVPPLMVLWVNLHGSFLLGLVLLGVYLCAAIPIWWRERIPDNRRRLAVLALWGGLATAALLLNPAGPSIFRYVFALLGNPAIQSIVEEWQAPSLHSQTGVVFFVHAALLVVTILWVRRRPHAGDVLLVLIFTALALSSQRHVLWFSMAAVPLWSEQLRAAHPTGPEASGAGHRSINLALLLALAVLVAAALPPCKNRLPVPPELQRVVSAQTPVATVSRIRALESPPKRLFHSESIGSYLMWAAPEIPVFVDVRVQLYPLALLHDYQQLSAGLRADELLTRYQIDGLLLDRITQGGLVKWARESTRWTLRFEEACCLYFEPSDRLERRRELPAQVPDR